MNHPEDDVWEQLIALSGPAYATGEAAAPFGFTTRMVARMVEARQRELMERTGMRALLASFAILLCTCALTLGVNYAARSDFDPGVRGLIQSAEIPFS